MMALTLSKIDKFQLAEGLRKVSSFQLNFMASLFTDDKAKLIKSINFLR
jgi:hypothetical protein